MREHEVVVIGAGTNGLIVAGYLAKAGVDVCVVERLDFVGGAVATLEVTKPGFKHDRGGTAHIFIQGNPLILHDELQLQSKFGLKYIYPDVELANVYPDDTAVFMYKDVEKTCESIAQFSEKDAESYLRFFETSKPLLNMMVSGLFTAPPPMGALFAQLDQSPQGQDLIRYMLMSSYDIVEDLFEHEKTKLMMTKLATEPLVGPEEKGTGIYLFLLIPFMHLYPCGMPEGGSGMLSESLARCIEAHGGTIRLNSEVRRIKVESGKATGVILASGEEIGARKAVVANLDPRLIFPKMVEEVDERLVERLRQVKNPSYVVFTSHYALHEAPKYKAGEEVSKAFLVEVVPWYEEYRRIYDDLRYNIPPRDLTPLVVCHTVHDPTRAPEGKHTLYVSEYEPYDLKEGGAAKWDDIREQVADHLLDGFRNITTNMGPENIIARTSHCPLDYERMNPNLIQGAPLTPDAGLYQFFSYRPLPELGQYRTPIQGLYLSGMATHPGGGIIGGGRATVQIVMEDLGVDFESVLG